MDNGKITLEDAIDLVSGSREQYGVHMGLGRAASVLMDMAINEFKDGNPAAEQYRLASLHLRALADEVLSNWRQRENGNADSVISAAIEMYDGEGGE